MKKKIKKRGKNVHKKKKRNTETVIQHTISHLRGY